MAADDSAKKGDGKQPPESRDEPQDPEVESFPVPLPPAPPGGNLQVQLGMALMQRSSFDRLAPEVQQAIVRLVDQIDDRGYQYALKSLEQDASLQTQEVDDRAKGRKQILWVISVITGLALLAGTTVTCLLIFAKQYGMAHTMMMSGLAIVGTFLGGAGLSALIPKIFAGGK